MPNLRVYFLVHRMCHLSSGQKIENAKRVGILSLTEHSLKELPEYVFDRTVVAKVTSLDLSRNQIWWLDGRLNQFVELKLLNLDHNALRAGTIEVLSHLTKLQKLSLAHNRLDEMAPSKPPPQNQQQQHANRTTTIIRKMAPPTNHTKPKKSTESSDSSNILPTLPESIKEINLACNRLTTLPVSLLSASLTRLTKVDLSDNRLQNVDQIWVLSNLEELQLDSNLISFLPEAMGTMKKLKILSLRYNQFRVRSTVFNTTNNIQPIPASLFTDTPLIDLNLDGAEMTNTQLNQFDGFQQFLDRRAKVKSKTMVNLSVCGLP